LENIIKPVFWTTRATKDLKKVTRFYGQLYGTEKAKEIALKIRKSTDILENPDFDFSKIGTVDSSFSHLKRTYRKLFNGYCKITYREGNKYIYIVRVFEERQNPTKNR